MININDLNVADGQITSVDIQSEVVCVELCDWQDKIHNLVFKGVIGVESYSPERVDLCHIKISRNSEKLLEVCSIVEEEHETLCEYAFISSWNDQAILRIYCESSEVEQVL